MNYGNNFSDLYKNTCTGKRQVSLFNDVDRKSLWGLYNVIDDAITQAKYFDEMIYGTNVSGANFASRLELFREIVSEKDIDKQELLDDLKRCRIDLTSYDAYVSANFDQYDSRARKNYWGGLQSHYSYQLRAKEFQKSMSDLWNYIDKMV